MQPPPDCTRTVGSRAFGVLSVFSSGLFAGSVRLLKVCGVNRFGHIAVPPPLVANFMLLREEAITVTFAAIQRDPPPPRMTLRTRYR